ncbi:MAG: FGGY-family carbohydrate kinase [Planctomycetia bacterium]|nr:FGGY-family carbohydrate kinase [Planctomycetia bacterium]
MYYLGIDNGGTMAKVAIFDQLCHQIAVCSEKVELIHPQHGWEEVNIDQLWESNARAIKTVLEISGIDPAEIACIACTGHGNGMYLVDESGKGLVGIRSTDTRARKYIEEWNEKNTLDSVLPKTMQAIWAAQPNALLRWYMDNDPETLEKTRWMFMVKDLLRYRLTGEAYMELTDASATSLMNNLTQEWDDEVLRTWGVESLRRILPPVVTTTQICGHVTAQAAAKTGLKEGTPVAGGMFDIDAVGVGIGMVDDQSLCLISGTWGNNQYISKTPVVSKDVFMTTCYSIPGYYLMLEGSATSASNFEWFITNLFKADRELMKQKDETGSIYDLVNAEIAGTKPEDCNLVFLPYLYASPVNIDANACFIGLDAWQKRGHMIRAVCEGVVFGHYWHINRLMKFRDMPNPILLTGGASKSPIWCQMFADIFQTVVRIPEATELGALGAAIAASVAVGDYPDVETACQNVVRFSQTYYPNSNLAGVYQKKREKFNKILEIMQPHWSELR